MKCIKVIHIKQQGFKTQILCFMAFFTAIFAHAQLQFTVDSTTVKIGQQITYTIAVQTNKSDLVVFPEGNETFKPLEVIESYGVDTLSNNDKFNLIKRYGLTQFDSGVFTIPKQKVIIGDKTYYTDSLKVEVNNVKVDTTKQKLYDIKPLIAVNKPSSNWWQKALLILAILAAIAFLVYWFIWRKKKLSEEEKIALLPPYDRAKLALKKLDETKYLETYEIKDYYSELTFILRKYLDEKVYNRSLESTTEELISQLKSLKANNQIDLNLNDINNIENILKRADLVKFAKSAVEKDIAKQDRNIIDLEIDHVHEALPEPTEEEKLLDAQYQEELARKKKVKKIKLSVITALLLLFLVFMGFGLRYGFSYVKDTIIGHESKELLEGNWVTSAYGSPPLTITTPIVLKRTTPDLPPEIAQQVSLTQFSYGSLLNRMFILVNTTKLKNPNPENKPELDQIMAQSIQEFEQNGAKNITQEPSNFTTPNGAEGKLIKGTLSMQLPKVNKEEQLNYTVVGFNNGDALQQVCLVWKQNDTYANSIMSRILNSVEIKKEEK